MYVHIGNNEILNKNDIIAVINVKTLKESRTNLKLINKLKERNRKDDESVIIMQKDEEQKEVFSNISIFTLKKRLERKI
jgi:hypothetical protein